MVDFENTRNQNMILLDKLWNIKKRGEKVFIKTGFYVITLSIRPK
jgi:hypothetical protein